MTEKADLPVIVKLALAVLASLVIFGGVAVIVLTVSEEKDKVLQSLDAGAAGYLLKTSSTRQIVNGLEQVFLGGAALSPAIAKVVLQELRKPDAEEFDLSDR